MKHLCLYYSATGNTARAVELLRRSFDAAGSRLEIVRIKKNMAAPAVDGYEGVVVAFPVYSFSPPAFVRRFIRSLPRAEGSGGKRMRASVLAVDGGGGGSAAARAVRLLERRGYDVGTSGSASYPENWTEIVQSPSPAECEQRTEAGDAMVESFASAVLSGETGRSVDRRVSPADVAIGFLFGAIARRFLGKLYYADEDCNACGLCRKGCPAGTITMGRRPRARPFWKTSCESCNACINLCPRKAIVTSIGRTIVLLGSIVACCILGIRAYFTLLKPALVGLSPVIATLIDVVVVSACLVAGHVLPLWPLDSLLLRPIQRLPVIRRFFAWTFMKEWRRYQAPAPDEGSGPR